MATREQMLERVRKALGQPPTGSVPAPLPPFDPTGVMLPLAPEDYLAKFEAEWEKVAGVTHRVHSIEELEAVLHQILVELGTHSVVLSRNPLLAELQLAERLYGSGKFVTNWTRDPLRKQPLTLSEFNAASFRAKVGITGVEYVLAETGSLVLASATEGAQIASLAPPVHVALYRRSQLVGTLDDLLAKLPISAHPDQPTPGRSFVFITGTSRTADIEQILIRGVHGPGENHVILVEDSCRLPIPRLSFR